MWNSYRPVYGSAKLVPLKEVARLDSIQIAEVVCRIEDTVSDVLKRVTVERIGSAARDDVHDAAGILAVLCVVVAGLNAELLQHVRKGKRGVHVGVLVDVIASVEHVVNLIRPRSIDGHGGDDRKCLGLALIDILAGR